MAEAPPPPPHCAHKIRLFEADNNAWRELVCERPVGHQPAARVYHKCGAYEWAFIPEPSGYGNPSKCTAGIVETREEPSELGIASSNENGQVTTVPILEVVPDAKHEYRYFIRCGLVPGHAGGHVASYAHRRMVSVMTSGGRNVERLSEWLCGTHDALE